MRAVTLSNKKVISALRSNFECGWTNIAGKKSYAGTSNTHMPDYLAKTVGNSAGHHNVQMFFMTSDARVVNCLPGFWSPDVLVKEAALAKRLNSLYKQKGSIARRNELFLDAHLIAAVKSDKKTRAASELQPFDKHNLKRRGGKDFTRTDGFITGTFKTADQVVHERMAERPFVPFERFDVKVFIDMGRKQYRYNDGVPGKDRRTRPTLTTDSRRKRK